MERGLTRYVAIVAMALIGGLSGTASGNDAYRKAGADTPASQTGYQQMAWNGWQVISQGVRGEESDQATSASKRSKAREAQAARQQRGFGIGYEYRRGQLVKDEAEKADQALRYRDARPDTGQERH